jgi:solute carrier family 35 protein F5
MIITLLSDYIYVIAMLKTTPLVATIGLSLTIPLAVIGDYFLSKPAAFQVLLGAVLVTAGFIVVGVEDSNLRERDDLLAQDLVDEGRGQQALLRLEGATPLESQATTSL